MEAYCVKCKSKKEMKSAKAITMKNGKPASKVYVQRVDEHVQNWEKLISSEVSGPVFLISLELPSCVTRL